MEKEISIFKGINKKDRSLQLMQILLLAFLEIERLNLMVKSSSFGSIKI